MAVIVCNGGLNYLLKLLLKDTVPAGFDFWIGLFQNNYTPVHATTLADLTPASFSGYAIKPLPRVDWANPNLISDISQIFWGPGVLAWTSTSGSQTVYGAYVTDPTTSQLLWAERFFAPQTVTSAIPATYLPTLRMQSLF